MERADAITKSSEQAARLEKVILSIRDKHADDPDLAETLIGPYRAMLSSVRAEIDSCLGLVGFPDADLVFRVESAKIGSDGAPSQLIVDTLESFRKALASTFVRVSRAPWAGQGRYSQLVRGASDTTVLGLGRGSVRIAVDLPPLFHRQTLDAWVTDRNGRPKQSPARAAVSFLLDGAAWADSDQPVGELRKRIPDSAVRKEVMAQIRMLSPSPMGEIQALEIEGGVVVGRRKIRLTAATGARARKAQYSGIRTRPFEGSGVLRKVTVDLDKPAHEFELRHRPGDAPNLRGDFPEGLRGQVLDAMDLRKRVRVRGTLEVSSGHPSRTLLHLEGFEEDQ